MAFSLPSKYGLAVYNKYQIVFIPEDQNNDPGWETIRPVISMNGRETDICDENGKILMTVNDNIFMQILRSKEFFVGWLDGSIGNPILESREIQMDYSGLLAV